ncbi:hypothetical protein QQF64_034447, partial [Cirrhinus molitorella]
DLYISMVQWVTDECLAVRWLNRPQNCSILTLCYTHTGKCVPKHVMTSDKWIDRQNEKTAISKDGETFFVTSPLSSDGHGSFRHLTMMSEQVQKHTSHTDNKHNSHGSDFKLSFFQT